VTIALILIVIAIILTFIKNQNSHRLGNGERSYLSDRRCLALQRKLLNLIHKDTAERLIHLTKRQALSLGHNL